MGTSTYGILCWGVPLDDDYEPPTWDGSEDADRIEDVLGCPLVEHCSYSYPCFVLAAPGTEQRVGHGLVREASFGVPDGSQALLDAALRSIGREPEPGRWLLLALLGV